MRIAYNVISTTLNKLLLEEKINICSTIKENLPTGIEPRNF